MDTDQDVIVYSIIITLVSCDNDVVTAEKWLLEKAEKEGWLKAEKLSGRDATQGYVGVMV